MRIVHVPGVVTACEAPVSQVISDCAHLAKKREHGVMLIVAVTSGPCVIMPDSASRPMHAAAPLNCPVESVIVNLARTSTALYSPLCSVAARARIRKIIVSGDIATTVHAIDHTAGH